MKTFLAKFRISAALDRGVPPKTQSTSEEVRRFGASMQILEERLRTHRMNEPVSDTLHSSIMRAVRTAHPHEQSFPRALFRWLPAPAFALLAVFGIWWSGNRLGKESSPLLPSQQAESLIAAATLLEQGREITQNAPGAALTPLSAELESLNRDLQNAVEFLVASVP